MKPGVAAKRLIGRKFDDEEVVHQRKRSPFTIVKSHNGDARVRIGEKEMSPSEVSALVLARMKEGLDHVARDPFPVYVEPSAKIRERIAAAYGTTTDQIAITRNTLASPAVGSARRSPGSTPIRDASASPSTTSPACGRRP